MFCFSMSALPIRVLPGHARNYSGVPTDPSTAHRAQAMTFAPEETFDGRCNDRGRAHRPHRPAHALGRAAAVIAAAGGELLSAVECRARPAAGFLRFWPARR